MSADMATRSRDCRNFDRIISLSDGVFAIAITIMVLSLAVPIIPAEDAASRLIPGLIALWPSFVSYMISFLVVGSWWESHHRICQYISGCNRLLIWLNLLFLLAISLIPFFTTLLISYPTLPYAVGVYALAQAGTGMIFLAFWQYAAFKRQFIASDVPAGAIPRTNERILVAITGFLVSVPVALFSPFAAQVAWILIPVGFYLVEKKYRVIVEDTGGE